MRVFYSATYKTAAAAQESAAAAVRDEAPVAAAATATVAVEVAVRSDGGGLRGRVVVENVRFQQRVRRDDLRTGELLGAGVRPALQFAGNGTAHFHAVLRQ